MGEYALLNGESVKIGTCEDMYYLRFDQRRKVHHERGNVNPVADVAALRFRLPWPDEDQIAPGSFKDYHRSLRVYGYTMPEGVDHGSIRFRHEAGYLLSMPCPEGDGYTTPNDSRLHSDHTATSIRVHRNGFNGGAALVAQKYIEGVGLVPIMKCLSCGSMWRVEDVADIESLAVAIRAAADRQAETRKCAHGGSSFLHVSAFLFDVADRVLAGILVVL